MQEIDLGTTLYEANKILVNQEELMTAPELAAAQLKIQDWFVNYINEYAMLLCNEQRDFTVFCLNRTNGSYAVTAAKECILCCLDRGKIISIEPTINGDAWEIWISIDGFSYCYILFKYDDAVIKC